MGHSEIDTVFLGQARGRVRGALGTGRWPPSAVTAAHMLVGDGRAAWVPSGDSRAGLAENAEETTQP